MTTVDETYLTTRELADLLRLGERKVYDLVASGQVPCVRATGKLLFPRSEILAWIAASREGPSSGGPLPPIAVGSHDPLLARAISEAASGLASFFDGSHDGLERFARREAALCALHVREADGWNLGTIRDRLGAAPVVVFRFARRDRGLMTAPGNPLGLRTLADLAGHRVARRQGTAASARLFDTMLAEAGHEPAALAGPAAPCRSEEDLARAIRTGAADTAFGLRAVAEEAGLGFVPLIEEELDLLVWQRAVFDPPVAGLFAHLRCAGFQAEAAGLPGYDLTGLLEVRLAGG